MMDDTKLFNGVGTLVGVPEDRMLYLRIYHAESQAESGWWYEEDSNFIMCTDEECGKLEVIYQQALKEQQQ